VYSLWCGILGDVDKGVHEHKSEALLEIMNCKADWNTFKCENQLERTRELCDTLRKCISRDPEQVARAQVSARTFAKIINDFAEPISLKAMVFYLSVFAVFWYGTNATWNGLRNKLSADHIQHVYHQVPPTPQRQLSGPHPPPTPFGNAFYASGYLPQGMEPMTSPMANSQADRGQIEYG